MKVVPVVHPGEPRTWTVLWAVIWMGVALLFMILCWKACSTIRYALEPKPRKKPKKKPAEEAIPPALEHRVMDYRSKDRISLKPDPSKKKDSLFPAGFPMLSAFGGFDLSQATQNPFLMGRAEGQPKEPVEKGVAVLIGVMEVYRGKADLRISTAVRDVREMAEAFQTFDFDTYSIHDQREEMDARPTARSVLGMLKQVKEDKVANSLVIYLTCHARISEVDSQVEFLLQQPIHAVQKPQQAGPQPQQAGMKDEWLPISTLADFAFAVNVTTYFLFDLILMHGVDAMGFLKRLKAALKHQPHTHVLLTCTQPCLAADDVTGIFAYEFRRATQNPYFKNRDVTLPEVRYVMYPVLSDATGMRTPLLLWNNELGHASLNYAVHACKTKGSPYLAPLVPYWVPRSEATTLKEELLKTETQGASAGHPGRVFIVTGPTAAGKTQMALHLAWDAAVQTHFTDGVYLLTMTQHDHTPEGLLRMLAQISLGFDGFFHNLKEAKDFFRQHLTNALVILDDVQHLSEVEPFQTILSSSSRHAILVLTREESLATHGRLSISLQPTLDSLQSHTLLAWAASPAGGFVSPTSEMAKAAITNLAAAATDIADLMKGDMAALSVIAGCVASKTRKQNADCNWGQALRDLESTTGAPMERALAIVLQYLHPDHWEMLLSLAVFPSKFAVSLDAILTLWKSKYPELLALKAASIIRKFCDMQLICLVKTLYGWAVLVRPEVSAALVQRVPDMGALHSRLAHAYYMGAVGPDAKMPDNITLRDWHLVTNDEYFYQHIFRSWKAAGMKEVTIQMKKFEWLRAKVWGSDIHSLLQDFEDITDEQYKTLHEALKLSKETLARACWELPSQLYGRLGTSLHGAAVSVCAGIERRSEGLTVGDFSPENELWLRPLFHSGLQLPKDIPANKHASDMHTKAITCFLFFEEGKVASGSEDGTVKIWDLDTGKCLATLQHPNVSTLVVTVDGHLCSGSREDRTIIKWMDWTKGVGEKQTVLEKPPKKDKMDEAGQDKYLVCLVKSGATMDEYGEPVRDAVLLYNAKDEDMDISQDPYHLLYICCDDQRPIMASWTHDFEVRHALIGEHGGFYLVVVGDIKGNVIILRIERYTPLAVPVGFGGGCPVMGGGGGTCPVTGMSSGGGGGGGGCPFSSGR